MGMFLNYQDIANNYTPNNLIKEFNKPQSYTKLDPIDASKPYEEYNVKGELEGYYWNYKDTINLEFNIDGEITIEGTALVYKITGQTPTNTTPGSINQRAYNIIDLRSWTCVAVERGNYTWQEDEVFTYILGGDRSVYVSAEQYLKNKTIIITLYNFRFEAIHEQSFNGNSQIIFKIDDELSKKLVKGIYYCSLEVVGPDVHQTIFAPEDCKLLVK